jgi:hypothetical protein
LIGAGVAIYEQATALGHDKDSNNAAASSDPATQANVKPLHDQAISAQTTAIVIGAASGVAFATGLYLVLSSSSDRSPAKVSSWQVTPGIGPKEGSLVVQARW